MEDNNETITIEGLRLLIDDQLYSVTAMRKDDGATSVIDALRNEYKQQLETLKQQTQDILTRERAILDAREREVNDKLKSQILAVGADLGKLLIANNITYYGHQGRIEFVKPFHYKPDFVVSGDKKYPIKTDFKRKCNNRNLFIKIVCSPKDYNFQSTSVIKIDGGVIKPFNHYHALSDADCIGNLSPERLTAMSIPDRFTAIENLWNTINLDSLGYAWKGGTKDVPRLDGDYSSETWVQYFSELGAIDADKFETIKETWTTA